MKCANYDSLVSKSDICYLKVTPTLALRLEDRRKPNQIRRTDTDVHTEMTKKLETRLSDQVTYLAYKAVCSDRQQCLGLNPGMLCPHVEPTAADEQVAASAAICVQLCTS